DAVALLERALATGECRRDELATLYRLSAQLAITVGDEARGEREFLRLLSIAPDAELPRGTSPKIQARFDAARAQVRERGALEVDVETEGTTVRATIESDPADLVAGGMALWTEAGELRAVDLQRRKRRTYLLALPVESRVEVAVRITDRHGNTLFERRVTVTPPRAAAAEDAAAAPEPRARRSVAAQDDAGLDAEPPVRERPPLFGRWPVWAGIAAGFAVGGAVFAVRSRSAQNDLDDLNMDSSSHDFREATDIEDRLRRDSLLANVGFALAAGAGITALAVGVHFEW
ncbi:MAG TPA: hypothetical protein VMZ28_11895, partial [Kofleriaceae bacterium]|nr:hypothetical protein [Kofleriaceae bacterium]